MYNVESYTAPQHDTVWVKVALSWTFTASFIFSFFLSGRQPVLYGHVVFLSFMYCVCTHACVLDDNKEERRGTNNGK